MSAEKNKAIVQRWIDGLNRHDPTFIDELFASDFIHHFDTGQGFDLQQFRQGTSMYLAAFPDFTATVTHLIAEGDLVVFRASVSGTHTGSSEWFGMEPTGNEVSWTTTCIVRISEGKIREDWEDWDAMGFNRQLGRG